MLKNRWWQISFLVLAAVLALATAGHVVACDDCCSEDNCGDCQFCHCCSATAQVLPTYISSSFQYSASESADFFRPVIIDQTWSVDLDRPPRILSA